MPGNTADPDNQKYLLKIIASDTAKYKTYHLASLDYAFKAFGHLTAENRKKFLSDSNYEFFRVLVNGRENHLIEAILQSNNTEDIANMRSIIHKVHKNALRHALNRGDVHAIDYYLHAFPSAETTAVMESVISENNFACISRAIERKDKRTLNYFLEHELTKEVSKDRLGLNSKIASKDEPVISVREKPEAHPKESFIPLLNFKEVFNTLLGKNTKVVPGNDAPDQMDKGTQTDDADTDTNSTDSERRDNNSSF